MKVVCIFNNQCNYQDSQSVYSITQNKKFCEIILCSSLSLIAIFVFTAVRNSVLYEVYKN